MQKRVPADVLDQALGRTYPITLPAVGDRPAVDVVITVLPVIKLSLRIRDPAHAKRRITSVTEQLERIFESIRTGPVNLSHKNIVALSGEIYREIRNYWEHDPGQPEDWESWKAFSWAAIEDYVANPPPANWRNLMRDRHTALDEFGMASGPDLLDAIEKLPRQDNAGPLEMRFGLMAAWVLSKHGIEATSASRAKLLWHVGRAALDAGWAMKKAAQGDYTHDPNANRFPQFKSSNISTVTFSNLFESWKSEKKPASSTLSTWRPVLSSLTNYFSDLNVENITAREVRAWKDSLLSQGRSPKNINNTYLACLHVLLAQGVRNDLLATNVASGIAVKEKLVAGTSMLPYEDAEVAALLRFASQESIPARRWLPLLAVCSGARVGELAQLWAERVRTINGVLAMELRPAEDGGTFKNPGSERNVPLHEALVEAGFLEFVSDKKRGPLFYGRTSVSGNLHASKGTTNHLAGWIRRQPGFNDPRKAPNHAIRHWWKSIASRVGIPDSRADAIQGHSTPGEASRYRHFDLKTLAEDINRVPVYRI